MKKIVFLIVLLFAAVLNATPIGGAIPDYKLGAFTGPVGGAAQDDNIKASLDLAHTDLDDILADTAAFDTNAEYATALWNALVSAYGGAGTYGQALEDLLAKVPLSDGTVSWNATALAAIEGEATDAIEADSLDKLIAADDRTASLTYPDSVATESIMAFIMSKSASPIKTSYNNTTDSLEAIRDNIDTLNAADQVDLDAILLDTGTTIPGTITTMQNDLDILTGASGANLLTATQASIDAIEADTAAMQPVAEYSASKVLTTIANGNNNLFTVAGGPVKIIEIVGYVTTQIEAKSCLINYNFDPTVPSSDTPFGTDGTALEINGDAVGALYTWNGTVAADLVATDNGVALGCATTSGIIVPAGSLELAAVVSTSATGAITFYVRYIPLASGATMTAQ
jgi:hypothetical protein